MSLLKVMHVSRRVVTNIILSMPTLSIFANINFICGNIVLLWGIRIIVADNGCTYQRQIGIVVADNAYNYT